MANEPKTEHIAAPFAEMGRELVQATLVTCGSYDFWYSTEQMDGTEPLVAFGLPSERSGRGILTIEDVGSIFISSHRREFVQEYLRDAISSVLLTASPEEVRLLIAETDSMDLLWIEGVPHLLAPRISGPYRCTRALIWLMEETLRRHRVGWSGREPHILAVFDNLRNSGGSIYQEAVYTLLSTGPTVGVHLLSVLSDGNDEAFGAPAPWLARTFIAPAPLQANGNILVSARAFDSDSQHCCAYDGPWHLMNMFRIGEAAPRIAKMWAKVQKPEWDESLQTFLESKDPFPLFEEDPADLLLPVASQIVTTSNLGSTSGLQRELKVGYRRAADLMDTMEKLGIVGPPDGSKPREVLMTPEEAQAAIDRAVAERTSLSSNG